MPFPIGEHQTTNLGVRSMKSLRARQYLAMGFAFGLEIASGALLRRSVQPFPDVQATPSPLSSETHQKSGHQSPTHSLQSRSAG